jgi:hypothetical protein
VTKKKKKRRFRAEGAESAEGEKKKVAVGR